MVIRNKYIERFNKTHVLFADTDKKLHHVAADGENDFVTADELKDLFETCKVLIATEGGYIAPVAFTAATTLTPYASITTVETVSTAVAFVTYTTNET